MYMKEFSTTSPSNQFNFKKHLKVLLFAITISSFLFTGCKKDIQSGEPLPPDSKSVANLLPGVPVQLRAPLGKYRVISPLADFKKQQPTYTELLKFDPHYRQMVLQALKVSESSCNDNTNLSQWLDSQLGDWNREVIYYAVNTAMLDLPTYYSLVFENSSSGQYFGQRGEYTKTLNKTFENLNRFWNIDSRNLVLVAMHGNMLADKEKVYKTYVSVYDLEPADALYYTNLVSTLLNVFPQYRKGNHPIFTFNAFAQSSFFFPPVGIIPAKIVMGDGIMEGYTAIGYGDVAPQAILAHEYGHQIQFQLGVFGEVASPEATRRTELMADAYSAYFLSHARGETMQWKRVKQFLQVFFNIGDCATTSNGHHGTPNQRMAAAQWAYEVANNAQKQGHILTSQAFTALFDAALPQILAH